MLSPIPQTVLSHGPIRDTEAKRFSLRNLKLCPQLQKQIKDIAIRRISAELLKSLLAIKHSELVEARNRIDVPHGIFGLYLENFYERRKQNTVYIDVLELVCRETLERAKLCIELEDLHNIASRIFSAFHNQRMRPLVKEISDSQKLLTIHKTIAVEFQKNSELLRTLHNKLNAFSVRETNAISHINNQVYAVQNDCVEAELVLDPIEFRYKLSYHNRTTDQCKFELSQSEDSLLETLDRINQKREMENTVSESIRMKQRMDIEALKSQLDAMTQQYDRDFDNLDGQISYKINAIEAMESHHRDCIAKLDFFVIEIVKLKEWEMAWEEKKHMEALNKVVIKKKKTKKRAERPKK